MKGKGARSQGTIIAETCCDADIITMALPKTRRVMDTITSDDGQQTFSVFRRTTDESTAFPEGPDRDGKRPLFADGVG